MKLNLLKLNDDKTELLVITYRPSTSQSLYISIKVGDQDISPSEEPPKNLGVIFYSTCSLKDHVSNVCRSINFNMYSIGKIRKYLDRPTVEKLVNATITSRLDYCNSLMFSIPKELISLQTSKASESCGSCHHQMAQIRSHHPCPRWSALAPREAEDCF